jgi:hypothetical protein
MRLSPLAALRRDREYIQCQRHSGINCNIMRISLTGPSVKSKLLHLSMAHSIRETEVKVN